MSPKILTLIAGASLGLLMSAACTVTSVDDDGSGGTGTGAGTTTNSGGSGTGGDATGGTGTGGDATGGSGGGPACITCEGVIASTTDIDTADLCGYTEEGGEAACFENSSCDLFFTMYFEACGDGEEAGACETQCENSLCSATPTLPNFDDNTDTCANCIQATPSYNDCIADI